MAKQKTKDEIVNELMEYIDRGIEYWVNVGDNYHNTERKRMEGLVHTILVIFDGESSSLPAFKLIPNPHSDDKDYHKSRSEDWYPNDVDISGDLHNRWNKKVR